MSETILICDNNSNLNSKLSEVLGEASFLVSSVCNGKDAQSRINKNKFSIILVDIDLPTISSFDILTYIRMNSPASRVIFMYSDDFEIEELGLDDKMAKKLGICTMVRKPFKESYITSIIQDNPAHRKWQETIGKQKLEVSDASNLSDTKFTKIAIKELYLGSTTLFDFYIRVGDNKYLKFLHKGETFSKGRLQEYEISKNVDSLYFLNKDRGEYIEFMNGFLEKYLKRRKIFGKQALAASKGLVDHFVSEVYVKGLNPKLVTQGKKLCDNLYEIVKADSTMGALIDALFDEAPEKISYTFLTAFFTSITIAGIEWSGETSQKLVIQGALLHEIGKLKLPDELRGKSYEELTPAQRLIYQSYPAEGFNLLSGTSVPQQVKQIIYQHREFINGKGYPNGLTGLRIFPLAKVVAFSSSFAEFVILNNTTPLRAMKKFIGSREEITKYDSECIKSFITALSKS